MDTGKGQWIVAILGLTVGFAAAAFAEPVHIYTLDCNLPIPNPDDPKSEAGKGWMADAIIEIPDHFPIADLDVGISLTHTKVFDLQLYLQSPTGARLCLNMCDKYFNGENYTQTVFDDEAETPIEEGEPPFTGRFRPKSGSLLSIFDGLDTRGSWRLQIYDAYFADTGFLKHFELIIEIPEPLTALLLTLGTLLIRKRSLRRPVRITKISASQSIPSFSRLYNKTAIPLKFHS